MSAAARELSLWPDLIDPQDIFMKNNLRHVFALVLTSALAPLAQASTLSEVYEQARLNDHTYKAAQANYAAGLEVAKQSRAGLLPQLNAGASWTDSEADVTNNLSATDNQTSTGRTQSGYSISLDQTLFDLSVWHDYQSAKAVSSIAEAEFAIAEQSLILRTAQAYFDALQAVDNLETAVAEENAFSHQLEQTRQRFEVGLTAITEVHEAQAVYDSATAERLIAEGRVGIAFEALEVITGRPYYQLSPLKRDLPVTPPSPAERSAWVDMAMKNNYTLQVASLNAEAAKENSKARKAGHYPTLSANLSYSDGNDEQTQESATIYDQDTTGHSIGVTLRVPIYNGGGISATRRRAAQQYVAAREQLNQAQRDIVQSTRSIHLTVVTSVTTVKARAQAITSNQSALEATQAGYDVGTRDLVDVLNAQRSLYRAQRDYFDALYAYVLSTLRLKDAAGTLGPQDIEELDAWLDTSRTVVRDPATT